MKLYLVPRNSIIKIGDEIFNFSHIDGAYSYCKDENGNVVHISVSAEVEIIGEVKP